MTRIVNEAIVAALCLAAVLVVVVARAQESQQLSPAQQCQAQNLRLEGENTQLRQSVASLQVQLEIARAPSQSQAIEAKWQALEKDSGCKIDRQTLAVKCKTEEAQKEAPKK